MMSILFPELASLENHLIAANLAALFAAVGLVLAVLRLA